MVRAKGQNGNLVLEKNCGKIITSHDANGRSSNEASELPRSSFESAGLSLKSLILDPSVIPFSKESSMEDRFNNMGEES